MLEIVFIIVGILIIATLFDKWQKSNSNKSETPVNSKLSTQESNSPRREKQTESNSSSALNKEIKIRQNSDNLESNDTEYKLYQTILYATKMVADHPEFRFNEKQKFELILFFYSYSFGKLYELAPELENLIWMEVQSNVYMYLLEYGTKHDLGNEINIDIGDFVNQRGELYSSEVQIIKSSNDTIPTKLIHCVFENPLNPKPTESHNLTNYVMLRSILNEPFSLLDNIGKKIIDTDLNFGNELKYEEYIKEFRKDNPQIELAPLKPLILNAEECKKIYHYSSISGSIPKGRDFYHAAKTVNILESASEEVVLLAAFFVFDKWIDAYKEKYGYESISKEHLLLIEHQIVQTRFRN